MHDIRLIRDDPDAFDAALAKRGFEPSSGAIVALDAKRRAVATEMQAAQGRRNEASKAIGQAMAQGDSEKAEALKGEVAQIKTRLPELEEQDRVLGTELDALLASIPNLPADDVPVGADEGDNLEKREWWPENRREFDFDPCEHADIAPELGMDFETGARLSGARFTFLKGGMARLHRALGQFMLDRQAGENGYLECNPPLLVKDEIMFGTGQLPKFGNDSFETDLSLHQDTLLFWQLGRIEDLKDEGILDRHASIADPKVLKLLPKPPTRRWLIPTAEVSLTNAVREQILDESVFPVRMTALTTCFRSEAGAAGKDTRGFIRQHQFEKVELVSICRPEEAQAEHEHMVASAEGVLQALELPYRTMLLCTGDMGFGARKTFDLEVWLPGQGAYREISSISWCGDFQARRMDARYKPEGEKKTVFVHTLNGSGLAVGRTLVAVLENYQQADGSVTIPPILRPYMGGMETLHPLT